MTGRRDRVRATGLRRLASFVAALFVASLLIFAQPPHRLRV